MVIELRDEASLTSHLLEHWQHTPPEGRLLIGIVGAPGSGKSTLAHELCARIDAATSVGTCAVVPMDGFHLDDALLAPAGLLPVKGSPPTFDAAGLRVLLERIRAGESGVYYPLFDRKLELSRNAAARLDDSAGIVLIEGNYLLLEQSPWQGIGALLDVSLKLCVPVAELERRLFARWLGYGLDREQAQRKIYRNDLPNGRLIAEASATADILYCPPL